MAVKIKRDERTGVEYAEIFNPGDREPMKVATEGITQGTQLFNEVEAVRKSEDVGVTMPTADSPELGRDFSALPRPDLTGVATDLANATYPESLKKGRRVYYDDPVTGEDTYQDKFWGADATQSDSKILSPEEYQKQQAAKAKKDNFGKRLKGDKAPEQKGGVPGAGGVSADGTYGDLGAQYEDAYKAMGEGRRHGDETMDVYREGFAANKRSRDEYKETEKAKYDAAIDRAKNAKVGEIGMWTDKSAGQKIGGAIAIAMGAFGDAMMQIGGAKGPGNQALKIIEAQVEREVARQKDEVANLKDLAQMAGTNYGRILQEVGDERIADSVLYGQLYQSVENTVKSYEDKVSHIDKKTALQQMANDYKIKGDMVRIAGMKAIAANSKSNTSAVQMKREEGAAMMQDSFDTLTRMSKATGEDVEKKLSNYMGRLFGTKLYNQLKPQEQEMINAAMNNLAVAYTMMKTGRGDVTMGKGKAWLESGVFPQMGMSPGAIRELLGYMKASKRRVDYGPRVASPGSLFDAREE